MTGGTEPDSVHPGYFLPTAVGGLIGASAAAQVHLHALAEASFGSVSSAGSCLPR
jgi:hypothetical protein